ncbi:MAG: biopolymer transporter ExbD [Desulfobacteraceae bacterium]
MINAKHSLRYSESSEGINITPLMDLIFLLLIFFMVTTSFVRETGLDVDRPSAETAQVKEKADILIGVGDDGRIFMDKKPIDIRMVRPNVKNALAEHPLAATVIVADKKSDTGLVIEVMDQCRLAGANNVSIAARRKEGA